MKKFLSVAVTAIVVCSSFTSCATLFGGKVDKCQMQKPGDGQPTRQIKILPLVADIVLFPPALIVDFATNAIYKNCGQ